MIASDEKRELTDWEKTLLLAIRDGGWNANALARASGVNQSVIYRFMAGERGIGFATAYKLGRVVGVEMKATDQKGV